MQRDYLVTIFSRSKGKTYSFTVNRRLFYFPLMLTILLVLSSAFFGQGFFQERGERQRLEDRVIILEKMAARVEEQPTTRVGASANAEEKSEAHEPVSTIGAIGAEQEQGSVVENDTAEIQSAETHAYPTTQQGGAKIDDPRVVALNDSQGFRLDFKLINLVDEPISGNVAIIASLKPPHQPRFVSFPTMQLVDGMPVKLRKTVGFHIRYFKYVSGRFYFPFSYAESFRILIYNPAEQLVFDKTLPAEEVGVAELSSQQTTSFHNSS